MSGWRPTCASERGLAPRFEDAVDLHRLLAEIERTGGAAHG